MANIIARWRGQLGAAAALLLSGLLIAACSAVSDEPAPVYAMGAILTAPDESVASVPIERTVIGPVTAPVMLAPSLATAGDHSAPDVIPLDNPPQPMPAPARQASEPIAVAAMPPPPPTPASTPAPLPPAPNMPPAAASSPPPSPVIAAPPAVAPPRLAPAPVAEVRAEPVPPPVPQPAQAAAPPVPTAEPARADIATSGLLVSARDDRAARSRPRYYYAP
jgi:outer membrane biosynthesis protein TonB